MARFILRSVISTIITMLLVSGFLFFLLEVGGRDVVVNLLGVFATPEQMTSYKHQLGLDAPAWQRYEDWLIGNDWRARGDVGYPLVNIPNVLPETDKDRAALLHDAFELAHDRATLFKIKRCIGL